METLAARISRDGPLNELDAVGWAIRLAKRIEALHALGVAHGSISPECVLTRSADRTSKAILADLRQTPSRVAYQSPERAAGGTVSAADDVWAIAATLYEGLTGSPAFTGANDAETRQRIAGSTPAPLAVFDVGDDDLQQILDMAFQRDRSIRTQSASALRRALEEWHPDPAVRALPLLEDEDATNDDDDDDDVRTVMRMVGGMDDGPAAAPQASAYVPPAAASPSPAMSPGGQTRLGAGPPGPALSPGGYGRPAAPAQAYGQPAAPTQAYGQPAQAYGQPAQAYGQPAAAAQAHGQSPARAADARVSPGAYGQPGGVPHAGGSGHVGASHAALRNDVVEPTLDDDDEARTVMREMPLQPVFDGGVLRNAGMARPAPTAVDQPAPRRVAPTAPGLAMGGPSFSTPRGAPLDLSSGRESVPDAATQAYDPSRGHAAQAPAEPSWGAPLRPPSPTRPDDDDEMSTMERESPAEEPPAPALRAPAALRSPRDAAALVGGAASSPGPAVQASAAQGAAGPPPAPAGFGPGAPPRMSATAVFDQAPEPGSLLGPSRVASFAQAPARSGPAPAPDIPPGAFSTPTSGAPKPSPFAAQGGDLIVPPTPDRSQRGLVVALVVVLLLTGGAIFLASRLGLLGAAPAPSPARHVLAPAPDALVFPAPVRAG